MHHAHQGNDLQHFSAECTLECMYIEQTLLFSRTIKGLYSDSACFTVFIPHTADIVMYHIIQCYHIHVVHCTIVYSVLCTVQCVLHALHCPTLISFSQCSYHVCDEHVYLFSCEFVNIFTTITKGIATNLIRKFGTPYPTNTPTNF